MNLKKIVISLFLTFLTAFLGSLVTTPSISTWYANLQKPFFNPPNWIFGPVWTLLFFLMAISFYLVWLEKGLLKEKVIFIIHLIVNFFWSFSFFYLHLPALALAMIIVLWSVILWLILKFYKISKTASYLLIPYFLWVSFASLLNLAIVWLNR